MDMMAFRFDICDNFTAVDAAIGMFYFYFDLYFLFFCFFKSCMDILAFRFDICDNFNAVDPACRHV